VILTKRVTAELKRCKPALDEKRNLYVLPKARNEQYDMMEIINRLVDNPNLKRTKTVTAKTIILGMPELTVGRNCCQPKKSVKKTGEMQFGGVIYLILLTKRPDLANCNQKKIPFFCTLLVLMERFKIRTWRLKMCKNVNAVSNQ
jgi:acetyl-CoA carboxylase carboxyltransferase component